MSKIIYVGFTASMRFISRTGVARALLPLPVRRALGGSLQRFVRSIVKLSGPGPYNVLGHRMWLDISATSAWDVAFGVFEPDTVNVFRSIVQPGMTVVDVGAHIGFYTLIAARLVGSRGRVYAFEPNPSCFQILHKNVEENGYLNTVRLIAKAVTNRDGKTHLFLPATGSDEASLFHTEEKGEEVEVETVTLDSFFAREGWLRVDLVKIDVEGSEVEVLEGMRDLALQNPGLRLIVEFTPGNQMRARGKYTELFDVLLALGFNKFYAIRHSLKKVSIPEDIENIVRMVVTTRYINILCEK